MYVLVWLDARQDRAVISQYGVRGYPAYGVLTEAKAPLVDPKTRTLSTVMRGSSAEDAAATLLGYHCRYSIAAGRVPPSADVAIAQLEFMRAYKETEAFESWLEKVLGDTGMKPGEIDCVKLYKALTLREDGNAEGGLKLLTEIAGEELTIREATKEEAAKVPHAVAPFVVSRGDVVYGIVSSDADARLTHNAIVWLKGLEADIPAPDDLDTDGKRAAAIALAAVLNRPLDAAPFLTACLRLTGGGNAQRDPQLALVEGLVLKAQDKHKSATARFMELVQLQPGCSYSPLAGVLAHEAAEAGGLAAAAANCAQVTQSIYGARLAPQLAERLE